MIHRMEFTAKNLTLNVGVLPLLDYTNEQRIFQGLDETLIFDNQSSEDIRLYREKTIATSIIY